MKNYLRNKNAIILLSFLGLIIIYTIFSLYTGNVQDKEFIADMTTFNSISMDLQQEQFTDAKLKASLLLQKYPDNYLLNWSYANSLFNLKDYTLANQYFETSRKIRPFLVSEPQFVIQYAQSLYYAGDLNKALKYFEQAQKSSTYQDVTSKFIADIKNRLNLR